MMKNSAAKLKPATKRSSLVTSAVVGVLFPIGASLLDIFIQGIPLSLESLVLVQSSQPLHWIIDCVPIVMMLFALQKGDKLAPAPKINAQVEQRATERVAKLTRTVDELKTALAAQKNTEKELRESEEHARNELETVQAELDMLKRAAPAQTTDSAFSPLAPSTAESASIHFEQDVAPQGRQYYEAEDEEGPIESLETQQDQEVQQIQQDQEENDTQFSFSETGLLRVPGLSPDSETVSAATATPAPAAERESGSAQPFDLTEALARVDGDHELLAEMAELFLEESSRFIKDIQTAVENSDTQTLTYAAHTLKGSVGNFAATEAAEAARQLEQMGRKGDLTGADIQLAHLEAALARLTPALTELRALEAAA